MAEDADGGLTFCTDLHKLMTTAMLASDLMPRRKAEEMSEASRALARNLRRFRKHRGLTQGNVAEGAGVPLRTMINMEGEGRASIRSIERVADFFGVAVTTMLEPDVETADGLFFVAQYESLPEKTREVFHRALASKGAEDKIRPDGRDSKGR